MSDLSNTINQPILENKRFSKKLFKELLPIFMQESLDEFCNFQMAYDNSNSDDAKIILHKLAGIAKNYGAISLVNLVKEIENNISENGFMLEDMNALEEELEKLFKFIKDEYQLVLD